MLILRGNDSDILSVNLKDILQYVDNKEDYTWKIIWLDGISRNFNIGELMLKINDSLDGYMMTAIELVKLSDLIDQLIELILIGDKDPKNLQKLEDDNKMKVQCEYFIELVDSSYWEITSKDVNFSNKIKLVFDFEEY